jgi:hypothetical protein
MLTFVGLPIFFMELSLGQFCSNGPLTCWEFAPLFQGESTLIEFNRENADDLPLSKSLSTCKLRIMAIKFERVA